VVGVLTKWGGELFVLEGGEGERKTKKKGGGGGVHSTTLSVANFI